MSDRDAPLSMELVAVSKQFGPRHDRFTALQPTTLTLSSRSRVGIIGESGSGKSTLSRICVGLQDPTSGMITCDGVRLGSLLKRKRTRLALRKQIQYIPQDTTSSFDPRHRLIRSVTDPVIRLRGLSAADARAEALEMITLLGLRPELAERYPGQVSGGQRQRFAIARSLVVQPRILVCDEVVSALDVSVQGTMLNIIKEYCDQHEAGLVFVSHGIPATAFVADELLVMHRGEIVERGSTDQVITRPKHEYAKFLIDAYQGPATQMLEAAI